MTRPPEPLMDVVTPQGIAEQRAKGWPDYHPERYCHRCGRRNIRSWWVESPLWNEAVAELPRGTVEILCPPCFTELWEQANGIAVSWELRIDPATLLSKVRAVTSSTSCASCERLGRDDSAERDHDEQQHEWRVRFRTIPPHIAADYEDRYGKTCWTRLTPGEWYGLPWHDTQRVTTDEASARGQYVRLAHWADHQTQPIRDVTLERRPMTEWGIVAAGFCIEPEPAVVQPKEEP